MSASSKASVATEESIGSKVLATATMPLKLAGSAAQRSLQSAIFGRPAEEVEADEGVVRGYGSTQRPLCGGSEVCPPSAISAAPTCPALTRRLHNRAATDPHRATPCCSASGPSSICMRG